MVGWGQGECPSSVFCLGLEERWKRVFSRFGSPSTVKVFATSVYSVYCCMEEHEMLLPDKPSYKCWKPVQREQRQLLVSSEGVEPRERREAPSG